MPCSFMNRKYFPISWVSSPPPDLWLGLHLTRMDTQDRRNSAINHWALTPLWLRSLLHSPCFSQNSAFVSSMSSCNIKLTPQIIFPPRFKLFEARTASPRSSALSTNTPWSLSEENPMNEFEFSHGRTNPYGYSKAEL